MSRNFEQCWNCGTTNFKRKRCWDCHVVLDRAQTTFLLGGGESVIKKKIVVEIPEGRHTGTITKVEARTDPYEYTDLYVRIDDIESETPIVMKVGAPTNISVDRNGKPRSSLAQLLAKVGVDISGAEIDEQEAVGKEISFMTFNEKTDRGTFARIQISTIELLE